MIFFKVYIDLVKAETVPKSPLVKDPFTASKRSKKDDPKENDPIEIIEENKLDKLENGSEKKLVEEKSVKSPKRKENDSVEEKENSEEDDTTTKKGVKKIAVSKSKKKKDDEEEEEESNEIEEKSSKTQVSSKYDKEEFKKTNGNKDYNYKIVSWNINGIRAWLEVRFILV